jgi:hypothetical protein
MTHILVKSGRVVVQGGRVLTSQDGAPCCCGPEGCVIVLLPCCSCPGSLAFIRDTPQVQAVWPFDSRGDGSIIRMFDGRCYRYVATVPEVPDTATREYVFDNIAGFVDECGDPSCVNDDCVQVSGGVIELGSPCSIDTTIYDCVDSFDYTYSESGFGRLILESDNPFIEYAIYAGSSFSGSWSLSSGGTGTWDVYTRGTRENGAPWDYSESYQANTLFVSVVSPEPAASAFVQNPGTLPPEVYSTSTDGVGQNPGNTGHNGTIDGESFCTQGVRRETTTSGGIDTTRTSIVRINETALGRTVYAFWSIRSVDSSGTITRLAYNRLVRRFAFSSVRFASGIEVDNLDTEDACEIGSKVIAYRCDAEEPSDPAVQIIVDLAEVPDPGSLQYRAWYEGHIYIVTGEPAEGDAAEVVWTLDECPEPPGPTGDVYRINICNSTTRAGGAVIEGDVLIPKVIGYRPGEGLQPGEGMVWANIPAATGSGGNVCLRRVACQPTTQVVTDAEIEYTSIAGNCRGQPVSNVDPRPGCAQVDGGGGVQPSDTLGINAPLDPAIQAEIARQAMMRSGQFPGRCPSCGG